VTSSCTCPPAGGHHGITLHADQAGDLLRLLYTLEDWLLAAGPDTRDDLSDFLAGTGNRQDAGWFTTQLAALSSQLTHAARTPRADPD